MNLMQVLNILSSIIYVSLLIILIIKAPKYNVAKVFGVFLSIFFIWSFFKVFLLDKLISKNSASLYLNLSSIGWIFLSSTMFWFILLFSKMYKRKTNNMIFIILFGIPLMFFIAQWKGLMSIPELKDFGWKAIWIDSIWTYSFFAFTFLINIGSIFIGFSMIKKSKDLIRVKQMKIIVIGGTITFIFAFISSELVYFLLKITNVSNIGSLFGIPCGMFTVFGLVKYKSLDITPKIFSDNIINTMFDNLILINKNKEIISLNNSTIRSFGYTQDELNGRPLSILLKNDLSYTDFLNQVDIANEHTNIETIFQKKNGVNVPVIISCSLIKNDIDIVEGIVCIVKDVTDIKKNEKLKDVLLNISNVSRSKMTLFELSKIVHNQISMLMDAKNFYIAIIQNKDDGVYSFPYIVDINPEEYVDPDTLLELKKSVTHYVYRTKQPLLLTDTMTTTMYQTYGVSLVGVDCKSWIGVPLKVTDEKIIGVMVLQSYTDSNKYSLEDLNILSIISNTIASVIDHWQTQKMIEQLAKTEIIGNLAGKVAHDLNNVLGAIVSYPDLILKMLPADTPVKKRVLSIQESGLKAKAIIQDLLTLARRAVAITNIESLNDIILEYINSPVFEKLKKYHPNVEIEINLTDKSTNIKGSALHLSKTIMNLVSNAAESITSNGKIVISTEIKNVEYEKKGCFHIIKKGKYIFLQISDNGVGISKTDLSKIFKPFYTKKKMGMSGTGLGMAVVWGTVIDHNGFIDVSTEEGTGTNFEVYFPVSKQKKQKKPASLTFSEYSGNKEKILVIDDIETQREIATDIFNELGYDVSSVSSGEEGIEYLKQNSIDLCILDMIMDPGIDGLDTYKEIKKISPGMKVIIASGYSESVRVKEALKIGAKYYIQKPYTIENMGMTIKNVLYQKI